jgi:hypothetical protein
MALMSGALWMVECRRRKLEVTEVSEKKTLRNGCRFAGAVRRRDAGDESTTNP